MSIKQQWNSLLPVFILFFSNCDEFKGIVHECSVTPVIDTRHHVSLILCAEEL